MLSLYWGNSVDGYNLIGEYVSQEAMQIAMNDYIKRLNFKSYYMRGWETGGEYTMCDYGSHTNFFRYKTV